MHNPDTWGRHSARFNPGVDVCDSPAPRAFLCHWHPPAQPPGPVVCLWLSPFPVQQSARRAPHPGTSGLLADRLQRPARWSLAISMLSSGAGGCTRRVICSPVQAHLRALQLLVTMSDPATESQAPGLGRMKKGNPPGLSQRHWSTWREAGDSRSLTQRHRSTGGLKKQQNPEHGRPRANFPVLTAVLTSLGRKDGFTMAHPSPVNVVCLSIYLEILWLLNQCSVVFSL